jgi:F0F1-type ATP synthase membrane subunit b/b'
MDAISLLLQYVVLPVGAFVWMLHNKINKQTTDIEVIKAQVAAAKESHDREIKEIRSMFQRVFEKLDKIEETLRK